MKKRKYMYLLALLPFLVIAFMYEIIPLITVIVNSFQSDSGGGFTLENYHTVASKLLYQMAITNSLKISLISAGIGILIAFLGARAAMNVGSRFRRVFMTILNMVSNFAGIPLAFAYMILLGNAGIVVQLGHTMGWDALANYNLYTSNGLAMVYVYFQIPLSTLLLIPAFNAIRKEWKEASMLLGAGSNTFWLKVGIPVHPVCQRSGCLRDGLRHYDEQYLPASYPDSRMFCRRGKNPEGTGRSLIRYHDGNHGHYDPSDQHHQ